MDEYVLPYLHRHPVAATKISDSALLTTAHTRWQAAQASIRFGWSDGFWGPPGTRKMDMIYHPGFRGYPKMLDGIEVDLSGLDKSSMIQRAVHDLAIMTHPQALPGVFNGRSAARLATDPPRVGSWVTAYGFPHHASGAMRTKRLRITRNNPYIQFTPWFRWPSESGFSGAPLINDDGEVVGIAALQDIAAGVAHPPNREWIDEVLAGRDPAVLGNGMAMMDARGWRPSGPVEGFPLQEQSDIRLAAGGEWLAEGLYTRVGPKGFGWWETGLPGGLEWVRVSGRKSPDALIRVRVSDLDWRWYEEHGWPRAFEGKLDFGVTVPFRTGASRLNIDVLSRLGGVDWLEVNEVEVG